MICRAINMVRAKDLRLIPRLVNAVYYHHASAGVPLIDRHLMHAHNRLGYTSFTVLLMSCGHTHTSFSRFI